jgi:hypothetical protein
MSGPAKAIGDMHKGNATALLALQIKLEDTKKAVSQDIFISDGRLLQKMTRWRS